MKKILTMTLIISILNLAQSINMTYSEVKSFILIFDSFENIIALIKYFLFLSIVTIPLYLLFTFLMKKRNLGENFKYKNILELTEKMVGYQFDFGYRYIRSTFLMILLILHTLVFLKPEHIDLAISIYLFFMIGFYFGYIRITKNEDLNEKALNIILKHINKIGEKCNYQGEEFIGIPYNSLPEKYLKFLNSERFTLESSGLDQKRYTELKNYAAIRLITLNTAAGEKKYKIFKDLE